MHYITKSNFQQVIYLFMSLLELQSFGTTVGLTSSVRETFLAAVPTLFDWFLLQTALSGRTKPRCSTTTEVVAFSDRISSNRKHLPVSIRDLCLTGSFHNRKHDFARFYLHGLEVGSRNPLFSHGNGFNPFIFVWKMNCLVKNHKM